MRKRPHLPPAGRGPEALRLTSAAARGELRLPVCTACGHIQYPSGEFCSACLSDGLEWRVVSGVGRCLATTRLHRSSAEYFDRRMPCDIATVRLDAGPTVAAHVEGEMAPGDGIELHLRLDAAGQAVFRARRQGDEKAMSVPNGEIAGRCVLVTGANGGIGRALVAAFAEAGAGRILAASRDGGIAAAGPITPLTLDLTRPETIAAAADALAGVEILVNNAGRNFNEGLLAAGAMAAAEAEIQVNYLGTLRLIRAVAPAMKRRNVGLIVNLSTILAHVNLPLMGSYCASKAALHSLTQGVRAELAPWGVRVMGVYPGAVDTAMSADFPPPKMSPAAVARETVGAILDGREDCYPGDMAGELRARLDEDAKAVERELAGYLPEAD